MIGPSVAVPLALDRAPRPASTRDLADATLDELAGRARSVADRVEAVSRRADVLLFRARLVLLIMDLSCPLGCRRPRKPWYVPGACARLGARGLRRAWSGRWGEDPRSLRTFRSHLGALERACVLVRSPGDRICCRLDPEHPERRPRYADTLTVLRTEREAAWWAMIGLPLLDRHPECRRSPERWRMILGRWRDRLREPAQLDLPFGGGHATSAGRSVPERGPSPPADPLEGVERAARIVGALRSAEGRGELALSCALARVGVRLDGAASFRVAARPDRVRGAAAMLAVAYARGDRVRNPGGWFLRAWRHAALGEMCLALRALRLPLERTSGAPP